MPGAIERPMAKIRVRLEQVPPQLRACFAVSCATRLERAFADFARLNAPMRANCTSASWIPCGLRFVAIDENELISREPTPRPEIFVRWASTPGTTA